MRAGRQYAIATGGNILNRHIRQLHPADTIWIAADSGAEALVQAGIYPDLLVGDLDSIATGVFEDIRQNEQTRIYRFPPEKDASDTCLALQAVALLEQGGTDLLNKEWKSYALNPTVESSNLERKLLLSECSSDVSEALLATSFTTLKEAIKSRHAIGKAEPVDVIVLGASGSRVDHMLANYAIAFAFLQNMNIIFQLENGLAYPLVGEKSMRFSPDSQYPYFSIFPLSEELTELSLSGFRYPLDKANVLRENASLLLSNEIIEANACLHLKAGKCIIFRMID